VTRTRQLIHEHNQLEQSEDLYFSNSGGLGFYTYSQLDQFRSSYQLNKWTLIAIVAFEAFFIGTPIAGWFIRKAAKRDALAMLSDLTAFRTLGIQATGRPVGEVWNATRIKEGLKGSTERINHAEKLGQISKDKAIALRMKVRRAHDHLFDRLTTGEAW